MKPLRFSLASMIVATTAIAILLGVIMWRYRIVRELNQLVAKGVSFEHDLDAIESVENISWLSTPEYAEIYVAQESPDDYRIRRTRYSRESAIVHGKALEMRLKQLGVTDFYIYFIWEVDGAVAVKVIQSFDELPDRATRE